MKKNSPKKSSRNRSLRIETLENREMLSVNPLGLTQYEHYEHGEIIACSADYTAAEEREIAAASAAAVSAATAAVSAGTDVWHLNSWATSQYTIYLDFNGFNGQYGWKNNSNPNYADTQIYEIWNYVAQKYASFDVNVSTDVTLFDTPDNSRLRKTANDTDGWGIRVVFGGIPNTGESWGGVAYVGSFNDSYDRPCYVSKQSSHFSDASAAVHEIGHTLGLSHDGLGNTSTGNGSGGITGNVSYYQGEGNWGPIMGSSYKRIEQLSREYKSTSGYWNNNTEDDLYIITQNGFGYRPDNEITLSSSGTVSGVIERSGDIDWLTFVADTTGKYTFSINSGYSIAESIYSSLYYQIALCSSAGSVITSAYASLTNFTAGISANLTQGQTYKLRISGEGYGTVGVITNGCMGFTDYGSIGAYSINISGGAITKTLAAPVVSITQDGSYAKLSWGAVSGAERYCVYRLINGNIWQTVSESIPKAQLSLTDTNAPLNTNFVYVVQAVSAAGKWSNRTEVQFLAVPQVRLAQSGSSVIISWEAVTGQPATTKYGVWASSDGGKTWTRTVKADVPASSGTITITDSNVPAGTWIYAVRALVGSSMGGYVAKSVTVN